MTDLIYIALICCILAIGLCVGSFLNVLIYRLPLMMKSGWERAARTHCNLPELFDPHKDLSLCAPRSKCPQCKKHIRWRHNIPVIGFLRLCGRCFYCHKPISWRYPSIELITGVLTLLAFLSFGIQIQTLFAFAFIWLCIPMIMIDHDHKLLPDCLVFPLLWLGLLNSALGGFVTPLDAIATAMATYVIVYAVVSIYEHFRQADAMGLGDLKLMAALGAWFGFKMLPFVLLAACIIALIIELFKTHGKSLREHTAFPFGPALCSAGLLALFFYHPLIRLFGF